MSDRGKRYTGGCLCGALRYEADGEPLFTGHCYCDDCRKASAPVSCRHGVPSSAVRLAGQNRKFVSKAARGGDAVRNSCPFCGSSYSGEKSGKHDSFTIYAVPSTLLVFQPKNSDLAATAVLGCIPPNLTVYDAMPLGACKEMLLLPPEAGRRPGRPRIGG